MKLNECQFESRLNNKPKISIIVAVYNSEPYIRRCLDSIKNQTYGNFEVLLINDGSKDKSGDICEEYSKIDKRFVTFHQTNKGICNVRCFGINMANGEYIIHIDPDDWIENNTLELMIAECTKYNLDICTCSIKYEYKDIELNKTHSKIEKIQDYLYNRFTKEAITLLQITPSLINKLIKTNVYRKNIIKYPELVKSGEDICIFYQIYSNDLKIKIIDKDLYHYDKSINQSSLTKDDNHIIDIIKCYDLILNLTNNHNVKDICYFEIANHANNAVYDSNVNRKEYRKILYTHINHILLSKSPLWRKINAIISLVPGCIYWGNFYRLIRKFIISPIKII